MRTTRGAEASPTARRRSRKLAGRAAGFLAVWLLTEGLGWIALGFDGPRWRGWSRAAELRRQVVASGGALGAEAGSRKLDRRLRRSGAAHSSNVLHPFLGFVAEPRALEAWAGEMHPQAANLGFPGNDRALIQAPQPDRLVVGVFGGSVAQIFASAGRPALVEALSQVPRFAGREVVVLNVALGGMKQPQQLMALNYLLALGAHFDVVVNLDGFNEVALPPVELVPRGIAPFYPRDWYYRTASLDPEARAVQGEVAFLRELRLRRARKLSDSPWRLSALANLVWQLRDRLVQRRMEQALAGFWKSGREARGFLARGPRWPASEEAELFRELAAVWSRSSRAMFDLCSARGIEYHHFLQPNQYLEGSKALSPEEKESAFDPEQGLRRGVVEGYPELRERGAEAAAEGLPFHDLTEIFKDVRETRYIDDCCHFNLAGNREMARAIAAVMHTSPAP